MADIKAKKVLFKNRDGEHLIPYVGDTAIENRITNCLLEVPQNIKLELNNGTLTLKAGSKVIVPNGFEEDGTTKKFDYVTVENDLTRGSAGSDTGLSLLAYRPTENALDIYPVSATVSGDTNSKEGKTYTTWYDTASNICKRFTSSTTTFIQESLPLALCTRTNGAITSLDKVFNGFGYIGSTIWVDKGVKGLIPNGRNEDGTLKNIEFTTKALSMNTTSASRYICLNEEGLWRHITADYDEINNTMVTNDGVKKSVCLGYAEYNNRITSFNPKQTFRAVDYNDLQRLIDREIGKPQISLDSNLPSSCVWLEGSTVSRTTYANLFAIYGTTYGAGDGSTTFKLPDFKNRAIWGSNGFGYLSAGLPNITGAIRTGAYKKDTSSASASGALSYGTYGGVAGDFWGDTGNGYEYQTVNLNASKSNAIYGGSTTVQPPAIKVRVYARYK